MSESQTITTVLSEGFSDVDKVTSAISAVLTETYNMEFAQLRQETHEQLAAANAAGSGVPNTYTYKPSDYKTVAFTDQNVYRTYVNMMRTSGEEVTIYAQKINGQYVADVKRSANLDANEKAFVAKTHYEVTTYSEKEVDNSDRERSVNQERSAYIITALTDNLDLHRVTSSIADLDRWQGGVSKYKATVVDNPEGAPIVIINGKVCTDKDIVKDVLDQHTKKMTEAVQTSTEYQNIVNQQKAAVTARRNALMANPIKNQKELTKLNKKYGSNNEYVESIVHKKMTTTGFHKKVNTFSHDFVRKADAANATITKAIHDGYNVNRTNLVKQEKRERERIKNGATSSLPSYADMERDAERINTYIDNDVLDPDAATGVFGGILPFLEPPSEGSLKEIKDAFKKYTEIEANSSFSLSSMKPQDMTRDQKIVYLLKTKYGATVSTLDSATILRIQNDILNRFADKNAINTLMAKGAREADVNIFKINPVTGQAHIDMEALAKLSPSQLKIFGVSEEERVLLTQILGTRGVGDFGTNRLGAGVTTRMISMVGRLGGEDGSEFAQSVNTGVQMTRYTQKTLVVTRRGIRQGATFIEGKLELHRLGTRSGSAYTKGASKKAKKATTKKLSAFQEKKIDLANKHLKAQQARQKLRVDRYQRLHTRTQIHITRHGITTSKVQVHGVRYRMNAAVNKAKDKVASSLVGRAAHATMHFIVATLLPILGMALLAFIALCGVIEVVLIVMVAVSSLLEALNPANVINNLLAPSSYSDTVAYQLYERLDVAETEWVNGLSDFGDIYTNRQDIKYGSRYDGFSDYIEKVPNLTADENGNLFITAFEVDPTLAPSALSLDTSAYNTAVTGVDGNETVGISANTNTYNRADGDSTSMLYTSAENGHTSNIKDIIAMTDVMYGNDMEGSDDDSVAAIMGESAAQLDWNAFWQDINNKFRWCGAKVKEIFGDDDAIERYNETTDNAITYGKVQSYALTLFYASHQSETNLSVGFYDIDNALIASGADQIDASGDGKCVTPLTGSFKIDYFMNASGAELLSPYIEDDNGIKCALNPASTAYCFSNVEISMGDISDSSTQCLPISSDDLTASEETFNMAAESDCWDLTNSVNNDDTESICAYRYIALTGDMDIGSLVDGTVSSTATEAQKITAAQNAIKNAIINNTIDDYKIDGETDVALYTKDGMGTGEYTLGTQAASVQDNLRSYLRNRLSSGTRRLYPMTYYYLTMSRAVVYGGYDLSSFYDYATDSYVDTYADYDWDVRIEKLDLENFEFSETYTQSSYYNESMLLSLIRDAVETEEITQTDGTTETQLKNPALLNYLRGIVNDNDDLKEDLEERTYVDGDPTGTVIIGKEYIADFLERLEDDDEELDDDVEEYTGFYRIYILATRHIPYSYTKYTHNCKGHDFLYCGGHVEAREQGVVYSITNEQVVMVNGEEETSPVPTGTDLASLGYDTILGKVTDSVDYSSLETAVSTGQPPNPVFNVQGSYVSTGLNLNTSGTGADMTWEKGMTEKPNIAFYLVKDIFDVDCMILKGIDIFPTRNYKEYEGWTASNMELAIAKYGTDWNEMYGFDIPIEISSDRLVFDDTLNYANSLYSESISASALSTESIKELSDALASQYLASYTDTKRAAVEDALSWVGRFHYNESHETHYNADGTGHHLLESLPVGTLFTWTDSEGNYIEVDRTVSCTAGDSTDFAAFIWNRHSNVKFSESTGFYNSATYLPGNIFRYTEDGKNMYAIYLGCLNSDFTLSTGQVLTAGTDYYIVLKDTEVAVDDYHGYDPYGTVSIVEKTWDSSQCKRLD